MVGMVAYVKSGESDVLSSLHECLIDNGDFKVVQVVIYSGKESFWNLSV